mmetsp:Transcript_7969/g.14408  ORF Transcript_7969/g.14408 Transcript_7969/m.14408 type:complete len:245 (+) Transcript_7969:342-1076(+)
MIMGLWRGASTMVGPFLRAILSFDFPMTTFTSLPLVPGGTATASESSWRVWVHTYFPSTVPPFPGGGGSPSLSSPSSLPPSPSPSPSPSPPSPFSLVSVLGGFGGDWVEAGAGTAAGTVSRSNPSDPSSTTPSSLSLAASLARRSFSFFSFLALRAAASLAFLAFFSSAFFLSSSTNFFCFMRASMTFFIACWSSAPVKKSVFLLKKPKKVSRRGSMPLTCWARFMNMPSNRSSLGFAMLNIVE